MEVPFISSGAMNRTHYTLVRKIETATSIQSANQYLLTEIKAIRQQLTHPALSLKQCKESLIILLFCSMVATPGSLPRGMLDFALSHAVNLAEAGQEIEQKRIGYLFCVEMMPTNHELQLMLVNTLRKDLESDHIPLICLALDNLIASSNDDLIPAVQSRLHDLLSYNSQHVRRRALLAFRSLSRRNPEFLTRITRRVTELSRSPHQMVASAALAVSAQMSSMNDSAQEVRAAVNELLKTTISSTAKSRHWFLLRVLHTLLSLGLSEANVPIVMELAHSSSSSNEIAVLRGTFLLLSTVSTQVLTSSEKLLHGSLVQYIRQLLTSRDPNDQYLFLSCLESVDPVIWAGTSPDFPAVLEGWEVERVMQFLDSDDTLIRRTTLRILNRIDLNIIISYFSRSLQTIPRELSDKDKNEYAVRLLEVVEAQSGQDGEFYARELKGLLERLEPIPPADHPVLEIVVEMVLLHVRHSLVPFRIGCASTLLTFAVQFEEPLGQTLVVLISALAAEHCGRLSISPLDLLKGLSSRLSRCVPVAQDVCLLAMLRIAADCSEIPTDVKTTVTDLKQNSGRHIRQRCDQFMTFIGERKVLAEIINNARSSSLPDFLQALHDQGTRPLQSGPTPLHSPIIPSSNSTKLRYAAYETPPPAPRLRARRASSSQHSISSTRSDAFSDSSHEPSRVSLRLSASKIVTAGELALTAGGQELAAMARTPSKLNEQTKSMENLGSRMDLIAFDAPFVPDHSGARAEMYAELDFAALWKSLEDSDGARGWSNGNINSVITRLHGLGMRTRVVSADDSPFIGDLKIVLSNESIIQSEKSSDLKHVVLRLQESDDGSCLWRLRSSDAPLCTQIKDHLTDGRDETTT